jgi:hypothetical protein
MSGGVEAHYADCFSRMQIAVCCAKPPNCAGVALLCKPCQVNGSSCEPSPCRRRIEGRA